MKYNYIGFIYYLLLVNLVFSSCNGQNNLSQWIPLQQSSANKQTDKHIVQTKPNPSINHVRNAAIQDRAGNYWFGTTANGLFRYDGKTSTHFTVKDGLLANNVLALYEDSKGRIWISSGKRVCYYNGASFTELVVIDANSDIFSYQQEQNKSVGLWSILEDNNGNIWFTAFDDGVYCYDGKKVTHFQIGKMIQSITRDNEGNMWFNFNRYDGKSFIKQCPWGNPCQAWVMCSLKDKNGNLWFSVKRGGLYWFNGKTFTHYTMKDGLCDDYDESEFIYEDKTGKIWVGTNGNGWENDDLCLSYFDGKSFHQVSDILNTKEFIHSDARPILGDKDGNIWISAGNSLFRYGANKNNAMVKEKKLIDFTAKIFTP